MIDDIFVVGANLNEHDRHLTATLKGIQQAGITVNHAKYQFSQDRFRFRGYIISSAGIQPDPVKTEALNSMPACKNVADVQRFLDMANRVGRFIPHLAPPSQPLGDLLRKKRSVLECRTAAGI